MYHSTGDQLVATVWISNKYKELTDRLSSGLFPTNMHFMIFASMVGLYFDNVKEVTAKERGNEIRDQVFLNQRMDGVVYLLALFKDKTADILRDENEQACWEVIETYAAGGFEIINNWLIENPADIDGTETILNKIKEIASTQKEQDLTQDYTDLDF